MSKQESEEKPISEMTQAERDLLTHEQIGRAKMNFYESTRPRLVPPNLSISKPRASNRGGARAGAGRKPTGAESTQVVSFRLTERQRERFLALGGAEWLRHILDEEQAD